VTIDSVFQADPIVITPFSDKNMSVTINSDRAWTFLLGITQAVFPSVDFSVPNENNSVTGVLCILFTPFFLLSQHVP
jgi:hypothetical protein